MSGVEDWDTTAANNATADSNINWAENQNPSTVNNSARAEMAAVAAWLRTMAAYGTVGGTADAITLTTSQTPSALGPALVGFIATGTNTGAVTLNRDSLGAKPLRAVSGSALAAGEIITGRFYLAAYTTASSGQWILVNPGALHSYVTSSISTAIAALSSVYVAIGTLSAPSGTKMLFQQTAAPTGWTKDTTHNNKALRLVTGTVSTGGSTAFTSVFTARTIAEANLPAHTHAVTDPGHTHDVVAGGSNAGSTYSDKDRSTPGTAYTSTSATTGITIGNTGSGTAMDFAVQYVDVVICTKD